MMKGIAGDCQLDGLNSSNSTSQITPATAIVMPRSTVLSLNLACPIPNRQLNSS